MKKNLPRLILFVFSTLLCIYLCLRFSETFFFDQFYYYKSVTHGYWVPGKRLTWKDFGRRAEDLRTLFESGESTDKNIPGINKEGAFTIAIIGDSYVWGQGIREEDRFSALLKKKFNNILPTTVISLGNSGDAMIHNYIKYKSLIEKNPDIDVVIFGVVGNDLIIHQSTPMYDPELYEDILNHCPGPLVYVPADLHQIDTDWEENFAERIKLSLDEKYQNVCISKYVVSLLPQKRAIFYNFTGYQNKSHELTFYTDILQEHGMTVVSPTESYFSKYIKHSNDFFVSKKENHPSKAANEMFAQQLYDYIIARGLLKEYSPF